MSIIYTPQGKAREYSPLAANLYTGCPHACKYCYVPKITRKTPEVFSSEVFPRRNVLRDFETDCRKYPGTKNQVLFSFSSDPYSNAELKYGITRDALKLARKYEIPVSILTKNKNVLKDLDVIEKFGKSIMVGMTLTFLDETLSKEWEPNASLPVERLETLLSLKTKGVTTWASFEPVIDPKESLKLITHALPFVDVFKVGKINNYQGLDKQIDWTHFLENVVFLLRHKNKKFYIKEDLRLAAPSVVLRPEEMEMDSFVSEPF